MLSLHTGGFEMITFQTCHPGIWNDFSAAFVCVQMILLADLKKSSWTYQGSRFLAFWGLKKKHVLIYCHLNQLQKSECVRLSMHLTGNNPPPHTKVEMISRHFFLPRLRHGCHSEASGPTIFWWAECWWQTLCSRGHGQPSAVFGGSNACDTFEGLGGEAMMHRVDRWYMRTSGWLWPENLTSPPSFEVVAVNSSSSKNRGSYSDRKSPTYCW